MTKAAAIKMATAKARKNTRSYVVIREDGQYSVITDSEYWNGCYSESSFVVMVDSNGTLDYCGE